MGRHTESQGVSPSAPSEVTEIAVPVALTRRQLREAATAALAPALTPALTRAADVTPMPTPRLLSRETIGSRALASRRVSDKAAGTRTGAARTAPPRGLAARAEVPNRKRHGMARLLSMTAMVFVTAIAVATSVPANALLSAQDIDARNESQSQDIVSSQRNGQSIEASGDTVIAGRDGVTVSAAPVKAFTSSSAQKIMTFVPNSTGPILWPFPVTAPLTDRFGPRVGIWTYGGYTGNFHSGLDFDPGAGTPIQAVADGIVSDVSSDLCGTAVVIDHNVKGEKFQSMYCHMVSGSPKVSVGQSITGGTIIGNVGATGMATGAHLHLEIHIDGNAVDPYAFLQTRAK